MSVQIFGVPFGLDMFSEPRQQWAGLPTGAILSFVTLATYSLS